jgi:hypothetical protein
VQVLQKRATKTEKEQIPNIILNRNNNSNPLIQAVLLIKSTSSPNGRQFKPAIIPLFGSVIVLIVYANCFVDEVSFPEIADISDL